MEMQAVSKEGERKDEDAGAREPVGKAKAEALEEDHYSKLQNPQEDIYSEAFCSGTPKTTAVKQTEGKTRLYQAACLFLTIICLVLLVVVIVLSMKLQTGVCPDGKETALAPTCNRNECLSRFPTMNHQNQRCHCDYGWLSFGEKCFFLSTTRLSWPESQRNCSDRGGSLAVISSQGLQQFLTQKAKMKVYWIGLTRNKDKWTWNNNSATVVQESYWADNPGTGDCGMLQSGNPDKNWMKAFCQGFTYFICQL